MRRALVLLSMLVSMTTPVLAQVSVGVGIGLPGVSIGNNVPAYPELVPVPGYPVYYAPRMHSNYFFYDGMYWVYADDNWYASSWYNGPWALVGPEVCACVHPQNPCALLPCPPTYFHAWRRDSAPRWGEHWGNQGNSVEADGTGGTAAPFRRLRPCRSISVSIQEIGIHARWTSRWRFSASAISTNRATPWCGSTIRSTCNEHPCLPSPNAGKRPGRRVVARRSSSSRERLRRRAAGSRMSNPRAHHRRRSSRPRPTSNQQAQSGTEATAAIG
jgi:hypothetical protein